LDERKAGFRACARILSNGNLCIDTRISRNPSRSNNGGDYYSTLIIRPDGFVRQTSSCDFWQPDNEYWLPLEAKNIGGSRYFLDAIEACSIAGILG